VQVEKPVTISSYSHDRIVRLWLLAVAALVFITLIVGGATRLTESGLSIVEWKPVTGILPPLSPPQWQTEFEKYQTIPQYRERHRDMNLDQFKTIYWWEWAHRLLGRLIGAAFLLPFAFFLWRGWIPRGLRGALWGIFALGALQGAVGWWMVSSGLSARVSVSQYRLAFHLTLACVIYAALLWAAQRLAPSSWPGLSRPSTSSLPRKKDVDTQHKAGHDGRMKRLRMSAFALMALVLFQIYLGALVAGLDAGLTYNTWPLIDGAFIPDAARLFFDTPPWRNFFENRLMVQFDHRMTAYLLWLIAMLHAFDAARAREAALRISAFVLAAAVTMQAVIGIVTLLQQAPLGLALLHQAIAVIVLTIAVLHAQGVRQLLLNPSPEGGGKPH